MKRELINKFIENYYTENGSSNFILGRKIAYYKQYYRVDSHDCWVIIIECLYNFKWDDDLNDLKFIIEPNNFNKKTESIYEKRKNQFIKYIMNNLKRLMVKSEIYPCEINTNIDYRDYRVIK